MSDTAAGVQAPLPAYLSTGDIESLPGALAAALPLGHVAEATRVH